MIPHGHDSLHVLQVVEATSAGVGKHVRILSEGLNKLGHDVTVAYSPARIDDSFRRFIDRKEVSFVKINMEREISVRADGKALVNLTRIIHCDASFDVIHGHSSKGGALARIAALLTGYPTVYTPHSLVLSLPSMSRAKVAAYTGIERLLGSLCTSRLIAVSQDEADFIRSRRIVSAKKIRVIPNALEAGQFDYVSYRPESEKGNQPITFGSAIRFSDQKAPKMMIEAFALARRHMRHLPMRLVIAGDGELLEPCRKRVAELGLEEHISLPGWIDDIEDFISGLDVFLISSIYEAGSYSMMEAMSAGLPVISTRVFGAGMFEEIKGNVLVPIGDYQAMAEAMVGIFKLEGSSPTLASVRKKLRGVGKSNCDFSKEHFRQDLAVERTLDVYRELTRASL